MLRVLYDYQIFSMTKYGGIARYFIELIKHSSKSNVLSANLIAPYYINKYVSDLDRSLVTGKYLKNFPENKISLRVFNVPFYYYKSFLKDVEIVHNTYYSPIPLKGLSGKSVITVFDMVHEKFPEIYHNSSNVARVKKKAVDRASHIICISNNTKIDLLERYDICDSKVSVVYLGGSVEKFNVSDNNCSYVGQPYILYVGNRSHHKNFNKLLEAYANNSRLSKNFALVCFGGGFFSNDEIKLIMDYKLTSEQVVQISGSDEELAMTYKNASVFVYPSLYEGFGIPLIEAMEMKCPVACSSTDIFEEIAGSAAEYFDPTKTESISTSILTVLESRERSSELIELGDSRKRNFSWGKCATNTYKIYKKIG